MTTPNLPSWAEDINDPRLVLYPEGWRQRRRGMNPVSHACMLLMSVAAKVGRDGGGPPVAVYPSHGRAGTVEQWDAYTSACDARSLICLAAGGVPDPSSGLETRPELKRRDRVWLRADGCVEVLPVVDAPKQPEPATSWTQLDLFEVAA